MSGLFTGGCSRMKNGLVSLITYRGLPDLDPDDQLLKAALQELGCKCQALIWDDETVDWSKAGVCLIRSTWDYNLKYEEFCRWTRTVSAETTLYNEAKLVLWNSKKTYLKNLSDAALPVIPTLFVSAQNRLPLKELLSQMGLREAVIKPVVGLASSGVLKIDCSEESLLEGDRHLAKLLENGEVMLQKYLPSVSGYGERALAFIDGKYSHCVRKSAFQKLAVAGAAGETPATASEDEIEIACQILAYLKEIPLYARVDLVPDENGKPLLIELELVEPSLFLRNCPESPRRFAEAVLDRALN